MNILQLAAARENAWKRYVANLGDYKPFTTFFSDLTIAELSGGEKAVRDTFNKVVKSWLGNYKYFTEFVLVLNHKIWEHYDPNSESNPMAELYNELWKKADNLYYEKYKDKDKEMGYFYSVLD